MNDQEREELRRFLAEEVMGWERDWGHWWTRKFPPELMYRVGDWQPDIRIEQAMMVARKIEKDGWLWGIQLWPPLSDGVRRVRAVVFKLLDNTEEYGAIWEEEAEAICRAVKEAWEGVK